MDKIFPNISTLLTVIIPIGVAVVLSFVVSRFVRVPKNLESPRTKTYVSVTQSIIKLIIYLVAIYYVLTELRINVTPLFASAGVIGIILGLGVRPFIEDFFTGIFILTQETIRVGDYVEINGAQGITEELGFRTLRIKDRDGAVHIFPNHEIKKIVNYSLGRARVVVDIPIRPNQSVDKAMEALESAIGALRKDKVLGSFIVEPSRVQGVERISAGSVVIRVLIVTSASYRWDASRKYQLLALTELAKAKILLA